MSLRWFSDEQFSDGTRLGLKLERVMRSFQRFVNKVPPKAVARRYFADYIVAGYTPAMSLTPAVNDGLPWLKIENVAVTDIVNGIPDVGVQNQWRAKGTHVPGLWVVAADEQFLWTTTIVIDRPATLDALAVWMWTDTTYANSFLYGAAPPSGRVAGVPVDDIVVFVEVDNPFMSGDRRLTTQAFLRRGILASSWTHDPAAMVPLSDGSATVVAWAGLAPQGLSLVAQDLNIPLPEGARVRLGIAIPEWDGANRSGWYVPGPPIQRCWDRQSVGWNLVLTEGTVN